MKCLLTLQCSPHGEDALSAQQVQAALGDLALRSQHVDVTARNLAGAPLPPISAQYATAITSSAPPDDPALALSERLIGELEASDGLLINTPMHNFTLPASLKLWIDHVLRIGRSFTNTPDGKVGLLQDRPTLVLVRSGGICRGDLARQPDFLSDYLRHALSVLGIHNVRFLYLQGLAPSADELRQVREALLEFLVPLVSFIPTGDIS